MVAQASGTFFGDWPLPKIDVRGVDAYRIYKLEESEDLRRRLAEGRPRTDALGRPRRPLSSSINKTIEVFRWLLSYAVEYGWIEANPAVGRRRRIKVEKSPAAYLESARQIATVLEAAGELAADPGWVDRRPSPRSRHARLRGPPRPRACRSALGRSRLRRFAHPRQALEDAGRDP